ncbi:exported hypothetical protein [Bradyrhizobium sp. STM 3843]|nr:exported hypothetical protein [Bradyrhizobium sp. STM 3843]
MRGATLAGAGAGSGAGAAGLMARVSLSNPLRLPNTTQYSTRGRLFRPQLFDQG